MTIDADLLAILACPQDKGPLLLAGGELYNPRLHRAYRIEGGIPVLLIEEARDVPESERAALLAAAEEQD